MMQIFAKFKKIMRLGFRANLFMSKRETFDCCFHFSLSSECFQVSHLLCLFVFYFVPDLLPIVLNCKENTNQISLKSK